MDFEMEELKKVVCKAISGLKCGASVDQLSSLMEVLEISLSHLEQFLGSTGSFTQVWYFQRHHRQNLCDPQGKL